MKKRIFLGLLAVIIIALAVVWISLESIVKKAVNKFGSEVTGTEVKLEGFNFSPFSGFVSIKGLTVANPENYKSPYLLSLGGVSVKVDVNSLFGNTIVVEDITVDKPVITYEMLSLTQNNIKQLQANIAKNTASETTAPTATNEKSEEGTTEKPSKQVIIKKVTVTSGELKAVTAVPGDKGLIDVKLPQIVLTDIGAQKDQKGESIIGSVTKILNKILTTASETVIKSGLADVKNIAEKNLNNAVDSVKDKVKSFGIFGKKE
ncbi:MAG: hypothetical protein E7018_00490 [Alphaproteobacteria bacterium]|nr:hypothetical protein [Alphaproteobacteria bacterium]